MENQNENGMVVSNQDLQNNETENQANQHANNLEFGEVIRKMLATAGTLELTEAQNKILYAPINDSDVYIKPDGLIYLSWIKYSNRLTGAFTGTGWAMIPQGMPKIQNNLIVWGFHLVIKGIYCGFAIGEQQYFDNGRMTFGEACEGAKSNALMRLCKALGIGLELWDKQFIERWLATYANKKWDDEKRKYLWSLKPNAFGTTTATQSNTQAQAPAPAPIQNPAPTIQPTINVTSNTIPQVKKQATPIKPAVAEDDKISENKDFLNQKPEKTETPKTTKRTKKTETNINDVPIEPISEEEVDGKEAKFDYVSFLSEAKTTDQLKERYEQIKTDYEKGIINEIEKDELRKMANILWFKIGDSNKKK